MSIGLGNAQYMDGKHSNLFHSQLGLMIKPIEFNDDVIFTFSIMTQSKLREEDGFIEIPIQDYNFIQINKLYIKYQIFKNLLFKIGMFADSKDEITPTNWPFYSIYSKVDFYNENFLNIFFVARHDLFSTYSNQLNSSAATNIERTRTELNMFSKLKFQDNSLIMNLKSFYDQYVDPDYTLSSLSVGREKYIDRTVTYHDEQYRIINIGSEIIFNFQNYLTNKVITNYWQNLSARDYNKGYLLGLEEVIHFRDSNFNIGYFNFAADQSSNPPVAISSNYYPGFQISSLHLKVNQKINDNWNGILDYRYENAQAYGQSSNPNASPGPVPVIPKIKFFFILEYAFDAS